MSKFECKDCGETYPNAELFVYHVDDCVPRKPSLTAKEVKAIRGELDYLITNHVGSDNPALTRRVLKLIKRMEEVL